MKFNKKKIKNNFKFYARMFFISAFIALFSANSLVFAEEISLGEPLGLYKKVYGSNTNSSVPEVNAPEVNSTEASDPPAGIFGQWYPYWDISTQETDDAIINQKNVYFSNNDFYWFRKYVFKKTVNGKRYSSSVSLPGNSISVRYVDPLTNQWVVTSDLEKVNGVKSTLFIDTDTNSAVIGVSGVYKNVFTNNTIEIMRQEETPVIIKNTGGAYNIEFSFPLNAERVGEIWCLQSPGRLVDWSNQNYYNYLKSHDLSKERRWSWDGYYFITPSNYIPSGENIFYRNSAAYTGSSFIRNGTFPAATELGFVMTNECLKNQNAQGFWPTGPVSQWLKADFNIEGSFYDTRFSTDFATSLIFAYKRCGYKPFLDGAIKYGEFFLNYANNNHYDVGDDAWLVCDYSAGEFQKTPYKKTHCSLNHHVNEINFLYYLYNETNDIRYYETANKMLAGIDNTKYKWVNSEGNLNYALYYYGTNNIMVDYPYLTYNDLFCLKEILNGYGIKNITVDFLMETKKAYMDLKGITEYKK